MTPQEKKKLEHDIQTIEKIKHEMEVASKMLIQRDLELTRTNDELKKINEAKSNFVSMAAHQLRTPLSVIQWNVEMLLSGRAGELNDKQILYQKKVHRGTQILIDLVNTLLHISQLELNTKVHNKSVFNIQGVAEEVRENYETTIQERKQTVTVTTEPLHLFGDPSLFRILIQNLLSNALKYSYEGGTIDVTIYQNKTPEIVGGIEVKPGCIVFSVHDTGRGIPQQEQDKIFLKLFRGKTALDNSIDGMGLGLYLVKLIVDSFNGRIWFESTEGVETTFYVTIPGSIITTGIPETH
ncbi:HAMP domain-containing histidine kinase [Patescibacteria group bacterium]|nr:HAMP domain-containing histidine kinase [Patescibacteria group bacterium]